MSGRTGEGRMFSDFAANVVTSNGYKHLFKK